MGNITNDVITVSKEELSIILDVTTNTLNTIIKRDTLADRLNKKGYKIVDEYKIGRCKAYDIQHIPITEWERLQDNYRVQKKEEHTQYSINRLYNLKQSRTSILRDNDISISGTTAKRYDDILLNEKAMDKDKHVYFKITDNKEWIEIDKQAYSNFWIECKEYNYILSKYKKRLRNKEITENTYNLMVQNVYNSIERFKGYMVVKFYTYKEAENTKKIIDMITESK